MCCRDGAALGSLMELVHRIITVRLSWSERKVMGWKLKQMDKIQHWTAKMFSGLWNLFSLERRINGDLLQNVQYKGCNIYLQAFLTYKLPQECDMCLHAFLTDKLSQKHDIHPKLFWLTSYHENCSRVKVWEHQHNNCWFSFIKQTKKIVPVKKTYDN